MKEEEALRNYVVWHGLWVWSNLGLPDSNSRLKFSLNIYNIENKDIPPKPKKGEELNLDLLQAKNLESMTPKRPWPSEQSPGAPRAWKVLRYQGPTPCGTLEMHFGGLLSSDHRDPSSWNHSWVIMFQTPPKARAREGKWGRKCRKRRWPVPVPLIRSVKQKHGLRPN